MAADPLIRLAGVTKRFKAGRKAPDIVALDNISFELPRGRLLGLVGPDAAGKTTLLRILAGLVHADAGEVEVMGAPIASLDRAQIGYMPQGGALYGELSVRQNLELYARLRGVEPAENPERLEQLYRLTGLSDFRERLAGRLSGGMRQKLAMACAVVAAPPLMLLDEPSVGVDPVSRREIWQLARELAGPDSCVVWATSILDDAAQCDEILLLHEGHIRFSGAASGLANVAKGRSFVRPLAAANRRSALREALEDPGVLTGGIEGEQLRVVARSKQPPSGAGWSPVPAKPDDGFAALLDDGVPLGESAVAAAFPMREHTGAASAAIAAVGLTKRYGDFTAAHDISFTIRPGEIFGLLGPNGAGKSTTFGMLCGLLTPSGGRGTVGGRDLQSARTSARQAMGYMPQKFALYGDLTVAANLRFVAGAYGLGRADAQLAIDRALAALSLEPYWTAETGTLPLGIKQRLSLAAAVLHTPPVLFLDEPTSGVDPLVRREFWHHINAIAERGVAVLVTTHFMDEAENCDRLLLINQAEAIAQGTPEELRRGIARGGPMPTLEEAFIALIEAQRANVMAAA
ncbi:MAG TPA: ATP-binding cassette domain-containing protein [Novosphingobium sp.]|nr:ATP-binding cassette domain-containing protein [Novosphingobium sp.]